VIIVELAGRRQTGDRIGLHVSFHGPYFIEAKVAAAEKYLIVPAKITANIKTEL
jgi:hypothetical protein